MTPTYALWLGDCLEEMNRIEDDGVDAIIADWPFGTTQCAWDSVIPLEPLWKQCRRVIKPKGAIVLFGSQPFTTILIASSPYFGTGKRWFRQELIWDKMQGGSFNLANKRPLTAHENILIFCQEGTVYNPQFTSKPQDKIRTARPPRQSNDIRPMASGIWKPSDSYDPTISYPTSLMSYSSTMEECNSAHRLHPTQKPVSLLKNIILTYTNEGDLILDNTCGSGSTLEAAMKCNRRSIGIEKNTHYFQLASQRLQRVAADLRGELNHLPMFTEAA